MWARAQGPGSSLSTTEGLEEWVRSSNLKSMQFDRRIMMSEKQQPLSKGTVS